MTRVAVVVLALVASSCASGIAADAVAGGPQAGGTSGDEVRSLLTTAEVQRAFPGSAAGQVNRTQGSRQVSALSTDLAKRERPQALAVFADLGKAIAARLR